jgi:hypothetical protein
MEHLDQKLARFFGSNEGRAVALIAAIVATLGAFQMWGTFAAVATAAGAACIAIVVYGLPSIVLGPT